MGLPLDLALRELYFNVNGGYISMEKLYRDAIEEGVEGVTRKNVKEWLQTQQTYIVHKPIRKHFKTQRTDVDGLAQQIQMDLVDMQAYSHANKGNKWILTVIEILSRYAFAVPAYRKGAKDMAVLDDHNIHHFSTRLTGKKAAIVERFNRTLKTRMWKYFTERGFTEKKKKWIDVLPDFVNSYNHSKHRTIGMKPADVNEHNKDEVWTKIYGYPLSHFPKPKFKVGDKVHAIPKQGTFDKGYTQNFKDEVYEVTEVFRGDPNMYKLINPDDDDDKDALGRYYEHELSLDLS
ncbi:uncharacterized transposon-derived [Paramuricea clavata]|uniref:Uncharacterized transposon-derived n=1 Tax=Paramuricea clavata TaxID=317549 RepID=A0A6S7J810_PARCT|nr:uncharacterized transposon-derived [Paramuricea clavata]